MRKSFIVAAVAAIFLSRVVHAADDSKDWRVVDADNLLLIGTKVWRGRCRVVAEVCATSCRADEGVGPRPFLRRHAFLSRDRRVRGARRRWRGHGVHGEQARRSSNDEEMAGAETRIRASLGRGREFHAAGLADLFAKQVGHVDGFPVGRDPKAKTEWIVHCPGTFAFARDNAPDTASTEFYIVIGEAPRRLDRNLSAFGRVIDGMRYLQKLERGDPAVDNGVIADKAKQDPITSMKLASDIPGAERPHYEVMRTDFKGVREWKANKKNPARDSISANRRQSSMSALHLFRRARSPPDREDRSASLTQPRRAPDGAQIDILLLHYTGMKTAEEALSRLCDPAARVSAHYTIDRDGTIYAHVPEERRAWHAGVSYWGGRAECECAIHRNRARQSRSRVSATFLSRRSDRGADRACTRHPLVPSDSLKAGARPLRRRPGAQGRPRRVVSMETRSG